MKTAFFLLFFSICLTAQPKIADFISVEPLGQNRDFVIPSSHVFQKIIEEGDMLSMGGVQPGNADFTGYVPIAGSSENGYLGISSESTPGGVTILDINFNTSTQLWETTASQAIDFSSVGGTARNCSGTVTPWNTLISCEEGVITSDDNSDNYYDLGWAVEIDPVTKTVIDKRWALGNFKHENLVVHSNSRTAYQGVDHPTGYLYKFVADTAEDLSSGTLYVYSGSKNGPGNWIQINNTTEVERNTTLSQSSSAGGTIFNGIEDVEIGPDGLIYFAVKGEDRVYRFQDSDPLVGTTVPMLETFVGDMNYDITHDNGVTSTAWGTGNDNLAFDSEGNLWVNQDGGLFYIWVVEQGHTQTSPKVKIFGRAPTGSESTGLTFSPDFRFMFLSIQHPSGSNNSTTQEDVAGFEIGFHKDISLVIALKPDLGLTCPVMGATCDDGNPNTVADTEDGICNCAGIPAVGMLMYQVNSSNDDAEEQNGIMQLLTSTDLELTYEDGNPDKNQVVGIRFENLRLPSDAVVTNAYMQFTTDNTNIVPTSVLIKGEQSISSNSFTSADNNISNRPTTLNAVAWNDIPEWLVIGEAGVDQRTPDLSPVIMEILSQDDWTLGSPITFIITGMGEREAESFDGSASLAPKLVIDHYIIPSIKSANALSELESGDFMISESGSGVILTSPNGTCFRLIIGDDGSLSTEPVVCPN